MMPLSWSTQFLDDHVKYVRAVRFGDIKPEPVVLDYGTDGPNPYGVGASSLAGEVRQWWYNRKKYTHQHTPSEYKFTAEQGRMMEIPIFRTLEYQGIKFTTQVSAKTANYGGFVDGIGEYGGENILFESKHVGASRYLDMWYKPLYAENPGYFWQAQAYLQSADLPYSLFIISAQDSSSVKKQLTDDKRFNTKKDKCWYDHSNEPNTKVFAFKLYRLPVHEYMDARALAMTGTLTSDVPPARELDINKAWQCQPNFCQFRAQCLTDGADGVTIAQLPKVETKLIYTK